MDKSLNGFSEKESQRGGDGHEEENRDGIADHGNDGQRFCRLRKQDGGGRQGAGHGGCREQPGREC